MYDHVYIRCRCYFRCRPLFFFFFLLFIYIFFFLLLLFHRTHAIQLYISWNARSCVPLVPLSIFLHRSNSRHEYIERNKMCETAVMDRRSKKTREIHLVFYFFFSFYYYHQKLGGILNYCDKSLIVFFSVCISFKIFFLFFISISFDNNN